MPKRLPKSKNTWVSLVRDFVKEWPEVLDGLTFSHMPVKYLKTVDVILKNRLIIHYDITTELKTKHQNRIAKTIKETIESNYFKIRTVDIKFDIPLLRKEIESKTNRILSKSFDT